MQDVGSVSPAEASKSQALLQWGELYGFVTTSRHITCTSTVKLGWATLNIIQVLWGKEKEEQGNSACILLCTTCLYSGVLFPSPGVLKRRLDNTWCCKQQLKLLCIPKRKQLREYFYQDSDWELLPTPALHSQHSPVSSSTTSLYKTL